MKTLTWYAFAAIVALSAASCKKQMPAIIADEIVVNDFKTLASQFKEPAAEYTTAPFFVWNAEITKEEIERDLLSFRDAGSSQVFVHPRPGLVTEYLSGEWFDLFRFTVEKGKELGMKVWMYDENSYPSGFGGGHVPVEMPESVNQGQGLAMSRVEMLPDTADKYYLCLKDEDGKFLNITSTLRDEKGKQGKYILFSKTYNRKSDWYGGFTYVDLLHPGVTQKFIEVTMKGYEKNLGTEFGKTLPGTFTDEPQINSPGGIRWTPDLFDVFLKQWKYDLREHLPSLYEETGDWKRVRHNYTQTLLQLFIDRWAKPWYSYCEEKGLKFTGHYWEHEWPNMRPGGDNMAMYAWHHVPSIDMLFNQWNDSLPRAQFGNIRSVKELASAANQTGRQRKLSETYGGSGWDLTFRDMKRNGDWEYALGVNLMNQHLTFFTMAGARKYDYPPTFDYHEPWWNDYKFINDHYARLSLALSSGRQVNDILVLEPTTSAWLYDSYVAKNPRNGEIGQSFQTFITKLEKSQVEYDLGSEMIISDLGSVSAGRLVVGKAAYSRVVIPPMTENLNSATFRLLQKFVSSGGKVVAFSQPDLIDGKPDPRLNDFFEANKRKVVYGGSLTDEFIARHLNSTGITFTENKGGTLYHHRRAMGDGQVIFLANSDNDSGCSGTFTTDGSCAVEFNTLTGDYYSYPAVSENGKTTVSWTLPPAGSLLVYIPVSPDPGCKPVQAIETKSVVQPLSEVTVNRTDDNALMIDFCDIDIDGIGRKDMHTVSASDEIFRHYGFRNGDPWNHSVQYRKNIVDRDTFGIKSGFTATYRFNISGKFDYAGMNAVIERPSLWVVTLNGTQIKAEEGKWRLDRSFGVYNISGLVRQGENIITLRASPMRVHAEVEPVYIMGNFSVEPADKGWKLAQPRAALKTGSWKEQGMPFYSWGMDYTAEFNNESSTGTKWELELGKWNGTVAEVIVNNSEPVIVAFPPYKADISQLTKPGKNIITVRVKGSLRNLMGPHHNNPPAGIASPGSWRNVKTYPSGKDYSMLDYGLSGGLTLYRKE